MAAAADSLLATFAIPQNVTPSTVDALRRFLFDHTDNPVIKLSTKSNENKRKLADTSRPKKCRGLTLAPAASTPSNASEPNTDSTRSKLPLATQVSNATLKILSDELKSRRKDPKHQSGPRDHKQCAFVTSTAKCASLALEYLRNHEKDAALQLPALQVDNGVLSLLDKCIGLDSHDEGLVRLVYKELRTLKERLDCYLGAKDEEKKTLQEDVSSATGIDDKQVAKLFQFRSKPADKALRSLMIGYQLAALKFLHRIGCSRTIEESASHFWIGDACSPAHLMEEQATYEELREKTAVQLDKLSDILTTLCRSPGAEQENGRSRSSSKSDSVDRVTTIKLKLSALYARMMRYSLEKRDLDAEKELWLPLSKILDSLHRAEVSPSDMQFAFWSKFYQDTVSRLQRAGYGLESPGIRGSRDDVVDQMIALARNDNLYDESLSLMRNRYADAVRNTNLSKSKLAFQTIHFARVCLSCNANSTECEGIARQAMKYLDSNIECSTTDLLHLFSEVSQLQRTAGKTFVDSTASDLSSPERSTDINTRCLIVFQAIKFLLWIIRKLPQDDEETEEISAKRKSVVLKEAASFMNSVLLCCRHQIASSDAQFKTLDDPLQDAIAVSNELEIIGVKSRVSILYWSMYKSNSKDPETAKLKAARRSVEVLQDAKIEEKTKGQFSVKLEKLAEIYAFTKDVAMAHAYLRESARYQIEIGALQLAAKLVSTKPLQLCERPDELDCLNRTLRALQQLCSKAKDADQVSYYDDENLPNEERGLLLELQLNLALEWLSSSQHVRKAVCQVDSLLRKLLLVYSLKDFPIRRTRVAVACLRARAFDFNSAGSNLNSELIAENSCTDYGKDAGLRLYQPHLVATAKIYVAFFSDSVDLTSLRELLGLWEHCLDESKSWEDLAARVDDIDAWKNDLSFVADYLDMQNLSSLLIPTLSLLDRLHQLQIPTDVSFVVSNLSRLARNWSALGYSTKAQLCLDRVKAFLTSEVATEAGLDWCLARSERHVSDLELEKSLKAFQHAEKIAQADADFADGIGTVLTFSKRQRYSRLIADFSYISAKYWLADNNVKEALVAARRSVKMLQSLWANLENRQNPRPLDAKPEIQHDIDTVQAGTGELESPSANEMPGVKSLTHQALNGRHLWPIVGPLFRGFTLLANLYSHAGLFQEAMFYTESAKDIAKAVGSYSLLLSNYCQQVFLNTMSGKIDVAQTLLAEATNLKNDIQDPLDKVYLLWMQALISGATGAGEEEQRAHDIALREIENYSKSAISDRFLAVTTEDGLLSQLRELQITETEQRKQSSGKATRVTRKTVSTKASKAKVTSATSQNRVNGDNRAKPIEKTSDRSHNDANAVSDANPLQSLIPVHYDILLSNALVTPITLSSESIGDILSDTGDNALSSKILVPRQIMAFRQMFEQVLQDMAANPAFIPVSESALAMPAVATSKVEAVPNNSERSDEAGRKRTTARIAKSGANRQKPTAQVEFGEDIALRLLNARDHLQRILGRAAFSLPVTTLHHLFDMLSNVSIILSAVTQSHTSPKAHPLPHSLILDFPKNCVVQREMEAIQAEAEKEERPKTITWPSHSENHSQGPELEPSQYRQQYLDILPSTWTALSLSINSAKDELSICRYRSGESPFILRLPLARNNSMETEERYFSFEEARTELTTIVDLSNYGAHEAKNITTKEGKDQWWAARYALDSRMGSLIDDIEKYWLGGFRGIFTQQPKHPQGIANFQRALQQALNRYLPSRQGVSSAKPINLDPRVLELFTGLGNPDEEGTDLDDSLSELLYFVVDILHFSGEPIAYDEVNFDSVRDFVVKTQLDH